MNVRIAHDRVVIAVGIGIVATVCLAVSRRILDPSVVLSRAITRTGVRATHLRVTGLPFGRVPSGNITTPAETPAVKAAASKLLSRPTGKLNDTASVALLATGRWGGAITRLEGDVAREPGRADYWSNLSAARFEAARDHDDFLMYASSLAAADRAYSLSPDSPEAIFNRAAALDALGLTDEAVDTRKLYLAVDTSSPWATETRDLLHRAATTKTQREWSAARVLLEEPGRKLETQSVDGLVKRFPQQTRTFVEGEYLARWAEANLTGDQAEAERWLSLSRSIAASLHRAAGEQLAFDAVTAIDRATAANRRNIAEAQRTYKAGRLLYKAREIEKAIPLLERAEQQFAAAGSPMQLMAAYFVANALVDAHRRAEAREILDRLQIGAPQHYFALHAQLLWLNGTMIGVTGKPFEALTDYRAAFTAFERMGEVENAVRMNGICATTLAALGNDSEAWRLYANTFRAASAAGASWIIEVTLNDAARQEIAAGRSDIARALLRIELSIHHPSPRLHFDALMWLAFVENELTGEPLDVRRAQITAASMTRGSLRDDALDELRFVVALHGNVDDRQAVTLLSRSIAYREMVHYQFSAAAALIERARLQRKLTLEDASMQDLEHAISLIEKSGEDIESLLLRDTYFGASRNAYEELTDAFVAKKRFERAFEIYERNRLRTLGHRLPAPLSIAAIQKRVPPGVTLLSYSSLPQQLLIVAIHHDRWMAHVINVPRRDLVKLRDQWLDAIILNRPEEIHSVGAHLYTLLVSGIRNEITGSDTVVIVPDDTTAGIPFSALPTPESQWLIEQIAIAFAPAASGYDGKEALLSRDSRATIVVDPSFDTVRFPSLPRLSSRDVKSLSAILRDPVILTGADATPRRVVAEIAKSELVHINAHAFSDARDASRSLIALAAKPGESSLLYSRDVMELKINARLVVLAGCETGSLGGGRGNIRSIALAFLASGARSVLATLWNVDDQPTSELLGDFYHFAADRGETTTMALRAAQIASIRTGHRVQDWAPHQIFVTAGGNSR